MIQRLRVDCQLLLGQWATWLQTADRLFLYAPGRANQACIFGDRTATDEAYPEVDSQV